MLNGVSFDLQAIDNITPMLNRIRSQARSLQGVLGNLGGTTPNTGMDGVRTKIDGSTGSMLGFAAAAGVAAMAVQRIGSAFSGAMMDGMKFQTMSKVVASDIQMSLGGSMGDNQSMLLGMQKQLAKDAASLPGVTADYNTMLNAMSQSVAMANQGDKEGFKSDALDIAKRATILATTKSINVNDSGGAINRAISGGQNITELLNTIDLFAKSPVLKSGILKGISDAGLTTDDWKEMTTKQRKDIVQNALKAATPDSLIKEFEGTTESLYQGIISGLTDPLSGTLGVLREVGTRENRTAMTASYDFLQSFKVTTGLISELADALGLSFDPMAVVIDTLDFVTGFMNNIAYTITRAKESASGLEGFSLSTLTKGIANWLNGYIKQAANGLTSMGSDGLVSGIWGFLIGTINGVSDYIRTLDYGSLGVIVGESLGAIVLWAFDLKNWINAIGAIFGLLDAMSGAILQFVLGALKGLVNSLIIKPIKSGAESFGQAVLDLFTWLLTPFTMVVDAIKGFIEGAKGLLNMPGSIVQGIAAAPGNAIAGAKDFVAEKASGAADWLKEKMGFSTDPKDIKTLAPGTDGTKDVKPLIPTPAGNTGNLMSFAPTTTINTADGSAPNPQLLKTVMDTLGAQYQEYKSRQLATGMA
jgi:hypothetical protein